MDELLFGNPWIFKNIKYYLETHRILPPVTILEKFDIIKKHFLLEINEKGEYTGIREFRKHLSAYTKNLPNSSKFRSIINSLENKNEILQFINTYYENLK